MMSRRTIGKARPGESASILLGRTGSNVSDQACKGEAKGEAQFAFIERRSGQKLAR